MEKQKYITYVLSAYVHTYSYTNGEFSMQSPVHFNEFSYDNLPAFDKKHISSRTDGNLNNAKFLGSHKDFLVYMEIIYSFLVLGSPPWHHAYPKFLNKWGRGINFLVHINTKFGGF